MRQVYTYFIQSITGGPIKIGKAFNPRDRMALFQTGSPIELKIVGVLEGDQEREWHATYKWARLHGEWFMNMPDLVEDINEFCDNGCAVDEDLNELTEASLVKIEHLRKKIFTYKENIKPSVIREWNRLAIVTAPGYVEPPQQPTLFTPFESEYVWETAHT